jgi:NAD(P)-dependent dehydrogenase (short-subunit alcohol dehydrogenase family)
VRDGVGRISSLAIFGGNSDLGAATAQRLAADGLRRVALAVRDPERPRHAAALRAAGLEVHVTAFDADDVAGHPAAVDAAFQLRMATVPPGRVTRTSSSAATWWWGANITPIADITTSNEASS